MNVAYQPTQPTRSEIVLTILLSNTDKQGNPGWHLLMKRKNDILSLFQSPVRKKRHPAEVAAECVNREVWKVSKRVPLDRTHFHRLVRRKDERDNFPLDDIIRTPTHALWVMALPFMIPRRCIKNLDTTEFVPIDENGNLSTKLQVDIHTLEVFRCLTDHSFESLTRSADLVDMFTRVMGARRQHRQMFGPLKGGDDVR